ncbi:hypothetical protein MKW92_042333 [Papaver armeniacum]|nr:hypothetical protein MKW92_042333 [Papaver armeniacum]
MNEEICSSTAHSDNSDHRRRQHYRLNARRRLSNLTAEERSRWLARRNESQRERRRARQHQLCGPAETGRQLQIQTSELERQHHVRHRDAVVTRTRSTNAWPSHRVVVAWEQPINNIGPSIPRGARLSNIKRLARDHCPTTTETFGQQSANGVGQSTTNVVRLSSIRRLARNHRSPTVEIFIRYVKFPGAITCWYLHINECVCACVCIKEARIHPNR